MLLRQVLGCFALAFATSTLPLRADEIWTEVRSPHLRVVTNGTVEQGKAVAADFERMRNTLGWRMPGIRLDLTAPLTVYAARDYGTFLKLHPKWNDPELFDFFGNWERNIAFVDLSSWKKSQEHPVFLGYVHEVIRQNSWPLPVWLDRGLTQLIGSARFDGRDTLVGAPTQRWTALKAQPLLPIRQVLSEQPLFGFNSTNESGRQQQINEAWGLTHFLTFGPEMRAGAKLLSFYRKLQAGEEPRNAFRDTFGDPDRMDPLFAEYVRAKSLGVAVAEVPSLDSAGFESQPLSSTAMLDEEGIIKIETRYWADGRALFERALHSDPNDASANEELGIIEFEHGHLAEARRHWEIAAKRNPASYVARFALTITGNPFREQTNEQRTQTLQDLQQITHIKRDFSPALVQIAILQWWRGDLESALRACEEAERLNPARSDYHMLHAELLLAHQPKLAAAILRRQVNAHAAEHQQYVIGQPYESILLLQQIPDEDRGTGEPLQLNLPPHAEAVRGQILTLDCADSDPRGLFHVTLQVQSNHTQQKLKLSADTKVDVLFSDLIWIGGGHSPVCFAAKNQPAFAIFKPASQGLGELLQLEVLEDVPDTKQ